MSLISQNALPQVQIEKIKRKVSDQPSVLEGDQEVGDRKEDEPDTYKVKKRKEKRSEEEDKQLEVEQEKEMKKLENSLFGSLYSPVEFGKEDDEELRYGIDESSALFFTDRSANSVLSVYEDDAGLSQSSDDEEGTGQRKPVWVDDEEEKTSINIAKVNRLRKLRKEEDESVISGSAYISRLRAQHVKLNPGTEWAQLDSRSRNYSSDEEDPEYENEAVLAQGYKDVEGVDDILRSAEDLVVKSTAKLLPGLLGYSS